MIDSHCHLDHEPLYSNISDVIKRSKENGLKKILTISTNSKSFENIKKITETHISTIIFHKLEIPKKTSEGIVVINVIGIKILKNILSGNENEFKGNLPM